MPALPTPGGSTGTWGTELNDFLNVGHNSDGTLKGDDPIYDSFGTPDTAFEFDTSSLTGLTALGSPDSEDANTTMGGFYFVGDNDNTSVGRFKTLSPSFTAITKCYYDPHATNNGAGLFIGEASPGGMELIGPFNSPTGGAGTKILAWIKYSNPSTYGGASGSVAYPGPLGIWLMARVTSSSNVDYYYTCNGKLWTAIVLARNPGITIGSAGLFVTTGDSTRAIAAFDYLRIWNSLLTIPA